MRLIDADALKESIICNDTDEKKILSSKQLHEALIKWIDDRETIDAAPVVHGHWIYRKHGWAECSVCHRNFQGVYDLDNADDYCRHCGAIMDGGNRRRDSGRTMETL